MWRPRCGTVRLEEESDFYPYGGERVTTDTGIANNFKFTGKERDSESGLDYFGARYYSSAMGRFLTPDWSAVPAPIPYATLANPQTLNLYSYVENNPITGTDPDGHLMFSDAGGVSNGPDGFSGQIESPIMPVLGNSKALGPDRACRYCDEQPASNSEEPKKKKPKAQQQDKWVNPTGGQVRGCDAEGCGSFGAPRSEGLGATHLGTDYVATPGQDVKAVHDGTVTGVGYAYQGDLRLQIIKIKTPNGLSVGEVYVSPASGIKTGTKVSAGQVIGTAQDIRVRYGPKITPHVHIQILKGSHHINPETLIPKP